MKKTYLFLKTHLFIPIPFIFYFLTCAPGIGSGQMAILLDNMQKRVISSYVNCHNLTNILGWFFLALPFGNPAYRANLEMVVLGGFTLNIFYFSIFTLFDSRMLAFLAAFLLMICHSMWWNSTIVEVYTMNALFTAVSILFFVRILKKRKVVDHMFLAFFSGLSIFNHVAMGFLCVGWLVCVCMEWHRKNLESKHIIKVIGMFLLGLSPWLTVFLVDWHKIGSFEVAFKQAFFGPFSGLMFARPVLENLNHYFIILLNQFPNGYFVLGFAGIVIFYKCHGFNGPMLGLTIFFFLNAFFFINYETWNRFCHLLPSIVLLVFFGSFSLKKAWEFLASNLNWHIRWVRVTLIGLSLVALAYPVYFYSMLTTWAQSKESIWYPQYANLSTPCFRTNEFIANPNKRNFNDYQEYVDSLFAVLPHGAIYIDDDGRGYYTVADYNQKFLGRRPDINTVIINSFGIDDFGWGESPSGMAKVIARAYFDNRPLFMISQEWPISQALTRLPGAEKFAWELFPVGDRCKIFRLKTQKENSNPIQYRPDLMRFRAQPLTLGKIRSEKTHNLNLAHLNLVKRVEAVMQDMTQYGTAWMEDDQLFLRFEKEGSWAEFVVESAKEAMVDLTFTFTTSYDYGVADLFLNEALIARSVDFFLPMCGSNV